MYINPIRTAQMNSYKNFPDDLCVNYIQYTLYSCPQLLLACIVSVNKRTCMLASFPGRLSLIFLTAYMTFELPGGVGEGLVQLLHHQTIRWT